MPAHMDDIPPRSPWPILIENGCRFSLVAMVTRLGLWLVKHGNKRNSKTNFRSTFKIGRVVHKNNSHKTMKPDFWCGCHGNQEAAKQGVLWRNLKFEKKIKKSSSWFCRYWSSAYVYQNHVNRIYRFWVTSVSRNPSLQFSTFWDISKNISEIQKLVKNFKLILNLKMDVHLWKSMNLDTFWDHFGKNCI